MHSFTVAIYKIFIKMVENFSDYSNYIIASYAFAGLVLGSLFIYVILKYFSLKKRNEK